MNELVLNNRIESFRDALTAMVKGIYAASTIYVEVLDEAPEQVPDFKQAFADQIPPAAWASFEKVGRKQWHPELLWRGGPNGSYIKKLPYSSQKRILEDRERYPMVTSDNDVLLVDLREVTKKQALQLFAGDHIRPESEQRAWLEQQKSDKASVSADAQLMPYAVRGGKVYFRSDAVLSRREMQQLLEIM